jgi:hypothetical protein
MFCSAAVSTNKVKSFRNELAVVHKQGYAIDIEEFQEVRCMKTKAVCILVVILIAAFAASYGWTADAAKIVVMNPRGIQPEIRKIPMAKRPATLDDKTVYIVDTKYPNTKPFVEELFAALKAKYPKTTWVLREKFGGYMDDDPNLWKEIKAKGAGSIVLVGH